MRLLCVCLYVKKKKKYLLYVVKEKKEKEAHWLTFLFFIKLNVKVK